MDFHCFWRLWHGRDGETASQGKTDSWTLFSETYQRQMAHSVQSGVVLQAEKAKAPEKWCIRNNWNTSPRGQGQSAAQALAGEVLMWQLIKKVRRGAVCRALSHSVHGEW